MHNTKVPIAMHPTTLNNKKKKKKKKDNVKIKIHVYLELNIIIRFKFTTNLHRYAMSIVQNCLTKNWLIHNCKLLKEKTIVYGYR